MDRLGSYVKRHWIPLAVYADQPCDLSLASLGACPSNQKICVLVGDPFTHDRMEIVDPEPIVCVENLQL
jgi:hypothetical protein